MVVVEVDCSSAEESNELLRAIWAECRRAFGKCAWQYIPHREGQRHLIHLGFANIGVGVVGVSILYQKRGVARKIIFSEPEGSDIDDSVMSELERVVRRAVEKEAETYTLYGQFRTAFSIRFYKGESFAVKSLQERRGLFAFQVRGFDRVDAEAEGIKFLNAVLDFLSVSSNSALIVEEVKVEEGIPSKLEEEIPPLFSNDFDWWADYPTDEEGRFILWENQKVFIDKILANEVPLDHPFLRASYHFHAAQQLLRSMSARDRVLNEVATVLLVSALEVATNLYPFERSHCSVCGQPIYKIRQRVLDLVKRFAEPYKPLVDQFYSQRSKYLHEGILSSEANYVGVSIPLLDSASLSGCKMQASIPPYVLSDMVGFVLRHSYLEKLV